MISVIGLFSIDITKFFNIENTHKILNTLFTSNLSVNEII